MDAYQLNLCGFEKTYMRRLSIFFKKRMGEQLAVSVWDAPPAGPVLEESGQGSISIWLGGEAEIRDISNHYRKHMDNDRKTGQEICFLTLTGQKQTGKADEIYAYQSADVILDQVLQQAQSLQKTGAQIRQFQPHVDLFLDIGEKRSLLPCGISYAQEAGTDRQVLLIDLIPCSGLSGLLELPLPETDFADLILSMRRGKKVCLSEAVVRAGNMDILPAATNPLVLYELSAEDIKHLLEQSALGDRYDMVVVLAGTPFPGIRHLFLSARQVICLQDDGTYSASRRKELYEFFRHTGKNESRWTDLVLEQSAQAKTETTGMHLLYEWTNGTLAGQLRQILQG